MSGDLRIGDAERDLVTAALREHYAQGRLTREELDERLDRALTAKTATELIAATADLPGDAPTDDPYGYGAPGEPGSSEYGRRVPWQVMAWQEEARRRGLAWPANDPGAWRAAMRAHRHEMRRLRHEAHRRRHEAHRHWHSHRGLHPRGFRGGPGPFLPLLIIAVAAGLFFGGFGLLKVVLALWIGSMIFRTIRHIRHTRA